MNPKSVGEKGQRIVIGELAKWDIDVAVPLSDNLPWDLIAIKDNQLYKVQVKSSSYCQNAGSVLFDLTSNNWHSKTRKKYTESDCDVVILCDFSNIYLLGSEEFSGRAAFSIRIEAPKNGQTKGINLATDYVISSERIKKVFNFST